ncbi:multiple sugar transport system permease protein [Diaminobutyricimonas aerilata]|uniref:Multiple sugar transport system permease protein n=1 Tax=Diaminobutyricimonas aerilata TaxID=1162967 RepID=A0A2M9CFY3_9MICO|nr:multiple sugar transport system permease protein [Diaminobutyricimonas aerilata]
MSVTSGTLERSAARPAAPAPPPGRRTRRAFTRRRALTIAAFLAPAAVFVAIFTYYPLLSGGVGAFRTWTVYNITNQPWVGFGNFETVLNDPLFYSTVGNTVLWVIGSLVPQFVIGFALALWLRPKFRFRGIYQALVFFPWAVSGFLIGILFRWMFNGEFGVVNDLLMKTGIIDTPLPWLADPALAMPAIILANVWYGVTFFAIMILAALQSVPDELYEAASLDGAGRVRAFWHVTVPYIRTTLALTVLLRTIWIFNFPDLIFGMTGGGPGGRTHIVTSYMIEITQQGDYGRASALGLIVFMVLAIFAVFYLLATRERKEALR